MNPTSPRLLLVVLTALLMTTFCCGDEGQRTTTAAVEETDACQTNADCSNNGTCLLADNNTIIFNTCECAPEFSGPTCELQCPCQNGGSCTAWSGKNATCACTEGFTGHLCGITSVLCPDNAVECLNGGVCRMADPATQTYGCTCPAGFSGYNCEYSPHDSGSKNIFTEIQDIEMKVANRMSSHAIFGIVIACCFGVILVIYAFRAFKRRTRTRLEWDTIRRNTKLAFDPANVSRHDVDML